MGLKKRYVAICLMLLFLLVGCVAAGDSATSDDVVKASSHNATVSVEHNVVKEDNLAQTEGSDSVGIGSDDSKDALKASNDKDVLSAAGNFHNLNTELDRAGSYINIYGDYIADDNYAPDLTGSSKVIDGHGGTWDRTTSHTGRIIDVTGSSYTFKNIIFKNAHANTEGTAHYGGAIRFADTSDITFENCTFDSCYIYTDADHEEAYGGAIYFTGTASNVKFDGCTFKNNYADGTTAHGGHGHESDPRGGAICFNGAASDITFNKCNFTNNVAKGVLSDDSTYESKSNGGAVCFVNTATNVNVKDSIFDRNAATTSGRECSANGGAISFMSTASGVSFEGSSFIDNGVSAEYSGSYVQASAIGGAVYFSSFSEFPSIDGCVFDGNKAQCRGSKSTSNCGAIYFGTPSSTTVQLSGLKITDSVFARSTSTKQYPVMEFTNPVSGFIFDNVTFDSNYGNYAALHFGSTVSGNTKFTDCNFTNNQNTNGNGGGLYIATANSVTIEGTTFDNNKVSGKGAGIYINAGNNAKVDNCTFANHVITSTGAAIYWGASSDFNITNSHFTNNKASEGSTVYFANSIDNINIQDSTFIGNEITGSHGGALDATRASTLFIGGSIFDGNKATQNGAGVYIPYGSMKATITNSTFANHIINGEGAAIYWGTSNDFHDDNSHFINNRAKNGATIYFANSNIGTIDISYSTFTDNVVTSGNGGALNIPKIQYTTTITNCAFEGNTASGVGNAIYYTKEAETNVMSDCEFNGVDQIYVDEGAEVDFHGNTQNSASDGYVLTNFKGIIGLTKNNFKNVIINDYGTIATNTYANISGNKTYETYGYHFPLNATIVDDNNNSIISYAFQFKTNHDDIYPSADTLTHDSEMVTRYEYYTVEGKDAGLMNLYSYNATIKAYPVDGSYTWLQDKIDKNDAFVLDRNVTFNPDYDLSIYNRYYNVINFVNGMLINKTFTLDGNGYAINGINRARIFTIASNDVTVKNTHVINGSSAVNGGAFYINSGVRYLTISDCSFENNNAKGTGGAIYANGNGQDIKITDSVFNANSAYGGGAIQFAAGSAYYNNIDIINSNFTNNKDLASNNWGGSAIGVNKATDVNIQDSRFDSNVARSNGAVIFDLCSDVVFNACNFTNNNVTKSAGAVYFANIREGKGKSVSFENCVFTNNIAELDAGAIYSGSKGAEITSSNFTKNSARNGAAIVLMDTSDVYKCQFENNTASGNGTIWVNGIQSTTDIEHSRFIGNKAYNGAGVYHAVTTIGAPRLFISWSDFINNTASHNGGAVYYMFDQGNEIYRDYNNFDGRGEIDHNNLTSVKFKTSSFEVEAIAACYFENNIDYRFTVDTNESYNTTGVIHIYVTSDVDVSSISAIIKLTDTRGNETTITIDSNNYRPYFNRDLGIFDIQFEGLQPNEDYTVDVRFNDNNYLLKNTTAIFKTGFGRMGQFEYLQFLIDRQISQGIYELNLTRNINYDLEKDEGQMHINTTFTLNLNGFIINARGQCRIFNITADNVVLKGITFMNGDVFGPNATADKNGGALFWCGQNGTIEDCEFVNNNAEYGGGVYFNSTATDSKIIYCIFDNNTATKNGGAIDCNATKMNLQHTTFENNVAQYGAALCREANANGGSGYDNTFIANHALIAGAALGWMNSSRISIDTYYFYDNYADEMGGAIYVGNGSGECEILNCEFERNYVVNATDGHGGAIDWFATKGTINNTSFKNNWAHDGGAVYIHTTSGNITINNTDFIENKAVNGFGGAINLETSTITVNKTNFIENVANEGGAIYGGAKGTTNYFYYCLFDGNVANATGGHGGAIDGAASSGCLYYSTFKNNRADYGGAIYVGGDSSNSSVYNSLFTNNVAKYNGGAIDLNATDGVVVNTEFTGNTAAYGGALCREEGAIGGSGSGNGFISNHATKSGGALAWIGSKEINITNYFFYNNTAEVSGGAIYGGNESEICLIADSVFIENAVSNGQGGAFYIVTGSAIIKNTTFTGNHAIDGGAIYAPTERVTQTLPILHSIETMQLIMVVQLILKLLPLP